MTIHPEALTYDKVVYFILARKPVKYQDGAKRSRIIYIGSSQRGAWRFGESMVGKAKDAFGKEKRIWGAKTLEVHVWYTKTPVPENINIWKVFESAALLGFREIYSALPKYNDKGKRKLPNEKEARERFNIETVKKYLRDLGEPRTLQE